MSFFAKLSIYVEMNQTTLDHRDQITLIIWHYEPNRAMSPGSCLLELVEELTMPLV
jgi:hypothetical protein